MGRITVDLIRRVRCRRFDFLSSGVPDTTLVTELCGDMQRAEHNEGMISNLEELALHQQHIEKIELLHRACRHLKILLLQSNLISKIQNLHRLKQLQYLNLALNNISKVENLQRCESLEKLDLTMNFIPVSGLLALRTLQHNEFLRDVYLMGNPCSDWHSFRKYTLALLPSLAKLDGQEVKPSERIAARQVRMALFCARVAATYNFASRCCSRYEPVSAGVPNPARATHRRASRARHRYRGGHGRGRRRRRLRLQRRNRGPRLRRS